MRCADFQLTVTMVAGGPSFRVVDVAAEETVAMRRQAKEEQDSTTESTATAEATAEPEIIGDRKSKTYYIGTCRPEKQIAEANKIFFKTTDDAEKAGFKLAKNCQ